MSKFQVNREYVICIWSKIVYALSSSKSTSTNMVLCCTPRVILYILKGIGQWRLLILATTYPMAGKWLFQKLRIAKECEIYNMKLESACECYNFQVLTHQSEYRLNLKVPTSFTMSLPDFFYILRVVLVHVFLLLNHFTLFPSLSPHHAGLSFSHICFLFCIFQSLASD